MSQELLNKLGNEKYWKRVEHRVPQEEPIVYKSVDDAIKHIEYSNEYPAYVSPKIDGIKVTLYYENGLLEHVVTKGDKKTGEDIYFNAVEFNNIPMKIKTPYKSLAVQGFLTISTEDFNFINSNGLKYKTRKMATQGIMRTITGKYNNCISFYATRLFPEYKDSIDISRFDDNFKSVENSLISNNSVKDEVMNIYNYYFNIKDSNFLYPIDGLIIKTGTYEIVALFKEKTAESKITKYEWSMGSMGRFMTTMYIEPVNIKGITVSKIILEGIKKYLELNAPVDSIVEISLSKSIPVVERLVKSSDKKLEIPQSCPVCGGKLIIKDSSVICENPDCENKKLSDFNRIIKVLNIPSFTMSTVLDLLNEVESGAKEENCLINIATVLDLLNEGLIKKPSDIFNITCDNLISVHRKPNSSLKILSNMENQLSKMDECDFIYLLNIPKITYAVLHKLKDFAEKNNMTLLELIESCDVSKLSKVLQPKKISAILNYIQNNKEDYYELKNIIFNRDKNKKQEKEIIRKINPWKKI